MASLFFVANQSSANWLKGLSDEMTLERVPLHALLADELSKRHRVMHIEKPLAVEETIKFLDRQNTSLAAGEWFIVRGSVSRVAKSAHFAALISEVS